ncbi:hypothetical protein CAL29_22345 [Bordetella genomosp. 10]|uniref:Uncharacterized protein n=2 Tax=Bordetella genomosp. 10 TaxID=1416804 RepID=A0A261S067_9BORD|nr:hypothetical protein CAL29_22345 [Bordetella genomosp. 10]
MIGSASWPPSTTRTGAAPSLPFANTTGARAAADPAPLSASAISTHPAPLPAPPEALASVPPLTSTTTVDFMPPPASTTTVDFFPLPVFTTTDGLPLSPAPAAAIVFSPALSSAAPVAAFGVLSMACAGNTSIQAPGSPGGVSRVSFATGCGGRAAAGESFFAT